MLLQHPIGMDVCVSIFICFKVFFFSFAILSLTHWLYRIVFLKLHIFVNFQHFFCYWFLVLYQCGWKRYLVWFQYSLICSELLCGLPYDGECFMCPSENVYNSLSHPWWLCSKTLCGCLRLWIVLNPIYTMFFPYIHAKTW